MVGGRKATTRMSVNAPAKRIGAGESRALRPQSRYPAPIQLSRSDAFERRRNRCNVPAVEIDGAQQQHERGAGGDD